MNTEQTTTRANYRGTHRTLQKHSRRFAKVIGCDELHLRKYCDPGHGWLAVPIGWLDAFGITGDISAFSYRRGNTAYLEEDSDATVFQVAAQSRGYKLFVDYRHSEHTPIRSYPSFW